jgi:hypothetical protein
MPQTNTQLVSISAILRSRAFRAGVADARAGRPARFDEYPEWLWLYEWGRQAAFTVPRKQPITRDVLARAFDRGDLVG